MRFYMFLYSKSRICRNLFLLSLVLTICNCAKSRKLEGEQSADESRSGVIMVFPNVDDRANFMELRIGERGLLDFLKKYFGDDALKLFDKNKKLYLKELRKLMFEHNDFFDFFADSFEGYVVRFPNLSEDPDIQALIDLINKNGIKSLKSRVDDSQQNINDIDSVVKLGLEKIYELLKVYNGDDNAVKELEEFKKNNCIDESGQFCEPTDISDETTAIPTVEIDLNNHDNKIFSTYTILMEKNDLALKEPKDGAVLPRITTPFKYPEYHDLKNGAIASYCVLKEIHKVMAVIKANAIKYKKANDEAKKINPKYKTTDPRATPFQVNGKRWIDKDGKSDKVYFKHGVEIDPTEDGFEHLLDEWVIDQIRNGNVTTDIIMNNFKSLRFDEVEVPA